MGVYIKNMELPHSCFCCCLNSGEKRPEYGQTVFCPFSLTVLSETEWEKNKINGRLKTCGLVDVSGYGDLIDAEKLIEAFRETDCNMRGFYPENLVRMQSPVIRRED